MHLFAPFNDERCADVHVACPGWGPDDYQAFLDYSQFTALMESEKFDPASWQKPGMAAADVETVVRKALLSADVTVTVTGGLTGQGLLANGATVTFDGISLPIVALGDKVAIDLSEALGTNMVMVFSK